MHADLVIRLSLKKDSDWFTDSNKATILYNKTEKTVVCPKIRVHVKQR